MADPASDTGYYRVYGTMAPSGDVGTWVVGYNSYDKDEVTAETIEYEQTYNPYDYTSMRMSIRTDPARTTPRAFRTGNSTATSNSQAIKKSASFFLPIFYILSLIPLAIQRGI